MKFKLTHSGFDGEFISTTYPTLELAKRWKFKACEWLHEMQVGEVRIDEVGDSWERIE